MIRERECYLFYIKKTFYGFECIGVSSLKKERWLAYINLIIIDFK